MFCCNLGCLLFPDLYRVCLSVFSCTVLFISISKVIGCEDRLQNDLYCVEWGVKLYSNQPTNSCPQAVDRGDLAAGICQQLLIRSIIQFCWSACSRVLVLATQLSIGFSHTCRPGNSTYVDVPTRCRSPTWSCGVPQGSVLAPILFVLYTVDILRVTDSHGLSAHMYADDTQVYGFCRPIAVTALTVNITDCVEAARPRCDPTGFNQIQTRQRWSCCGARPLGDNISDRRRLCRSTAALSQSLQSSLLTIGTYTSTATCRCGHTSNVPCRDASPRYVNYVRSVVLCRRPHFRCSCCTGALPAGLWERCAGRPSSLPDASTPVGPERGGSTDLPSEDP